MISSMFATQWFITVYTYNMPFSIVLRMWDVFLQEVRPLPLPIRSHAIPNG